MIDQSRRSSCANNQPPRAWPPLARALSLAAVVLLIMLTGCRSIPFEPAPKGDFRNVDADTVLEGFDNAVGKRFSSLQAISFQFLTRDITGMGYVAIDPEERSYALAIMNPAGIKLLEFCGSGEQLEELFVPPQLKQRGAAAIRAIARDIRRIYFDWLPETRGELRRKRDALRFRDEEGDTRVDYTFSGIDRRLTRKRFRRGRKTLCIVNYYDYREIGDKCYPHGIVLRNKQYHYRLILRVKSIHNAQPANER